MKRRILSLLLALCMVLSLLPATALATGEETTEDVGYEPITITIAGTYIWSVDPTAEGAEIYKYAKVESNVPSDTTADDPDWNIMLDYSRSVPVLTLRNMILGKKGAELKTFGIKAVGDGALNISVEGGNSSVFTNDFSCTSLSMGKGVTISSVGEAKLILDTTKNTSNHVGISVLAGNLLLHNANIEIYTRGSNATSYSFPIQTKATDNGGDVEINGGTVYLDARNNSSGIVTTGNLKITGGAQVTIDKTVYNADATKDKTFSHGVKVGTKKSIEISDLGSTLVIKYAKNQFDNSLNARPVLAKDSLGQLVAMSGSKYDGSDASGINVEDIVINASRTGENNVVYPYLSFRVVCEEGNHAFDNDCTTADKCSKCGDAATANLEHAYAEQWNEEGKKPCANCDAVLVCAHETTELKGKVEATCGKDGYTGDTVCTECGVTTATGTTAPATKEHAYAEQWNEEGKKPCANCDAVLVCAHETTELKGKVEATCGKDGYTGDTVCTECGVTTATGTTAPATGDHTYDDEFDADCNVCGQDREAKTLVAIVNGAKYENMTDALAAAVNGGVLELYANVNTANKFEVTASLVIKGNRKTWTYTGTSRAITVENTADADLTIENLTVEAANSERGINYNTTGKLTLDNVNVTSNNYSVSLPGSSVRATVTITNSTLTGKNTVNVWGKNSVITITNTNITSVDNNAIEDYAAIMLNNNGETCADGVEVIINGGSIVAKNEKGEPCNVVINQTATAKVTISDETVRDGEIVNFVAVITYPNGTYYSFDTLAEAVEEAEAGDIIKLIANAEVKTSIKVTNTVVVDLNGYTLTGPDDGKANWYAFIVDGGDLTLKDSTGNGQLYAKCYGVETKSGSFTLDGAKIVATKNKTVGTAIVNFGGTVIVKSGFASGASDAVYTGGYFSNATTTILGGTIEGTVSVENWVEKDFTESVTSASNTYATSEDYKWVEQDGTYVLTAKEYVAENTTTGAKYESLQTAIAAAKAGETVELLADVTITETITANGITIDGAGFTLDATALGTATSKDSIVAAINSTKGLTVKNLTINGGVRGIYVDGTRIGLDYDVVIENVKILNSVRAFNVTDYSGKPSESKLIVIGGEFAGKISWSSLLDATFEGAVFSTNASTKGNVIDLRGTVTFTNCTFNEGYTLSGEDLVGGEVIKVVNTTVAAPAGYCWNNSGVLGVHAMGEATCTEDGVCANNCGEINKAPGHTYDDDFTSKCKVCGEVRENALTLVAMIGNVKYASLAEALEAANDGEEIILKTNDTGAGLIIDKNVTINFGEKTYTINAPVGSVGTVSNGIQILAGNNVTLKNGKLQIRHTNRSEFYILIQNYANLIVEDMILNGTHLDKYSATDGDSYVLSNNSGTVTIRNTEIIDNNEGKLAFALDSCKYKTYAIPNVTIESGTINGNMQVTGGNLTLNGGTFNGKLDYAGAGVVTNNTDAELVVSNGYCWQDSILKAHIEVTDDAVNATCTTTGLTEGKHCSACKAILVAQKLVSATGHNFSEFVETVKPTHKDKGYTTYGCANCDATMNSDYVGALTSAVAEFEGKYYNTLAEALEAAKESTSKEEKIITMVRNQTGDALVIGTNVTIDFGGFAYTVKTVNENGSAITIDADVILKNGTIQTLYTARNLFNYLIVNNGNLTTMNITLAGKHLLAEGEIATIVNNGILNLNADTVVSVRVNGLVANSVNVTKDASVVLKAPADYEWTNNGTTLSVHNHVYTHKVVVVEPDFEHHGHTQNICVCGAVSKTNFTSKLVAYAQIEDQDGKVLQLYETFAAAVADAKAGQTVKLLKNQTGAALVINEDNDGITINLGGNTYTVNKDESGAAVVIDEDATVTFTNGIVQIRYTVRTDFNCLVENNGTLNVDSTVKLNAANAKAEGAVAIKGNSVIVIES